MIKRDIFICDCHSLEHQYTFWYDEEYNQLYFEPHLYNGGPWYYRVWGRIKYVFGYKTGGGAWDSVIIKPEDAIGIMNYLKKVANKEIEGVADRGRD